MTGAGGFIGSHLTERLVTLGARVCALVHYRSDGSWGWLDHSRLKNEVEVTAGDIRDRDSVGQALEGQDIVFHLAALVGIPYSYRTPLSYVRTNIEGTLNVLQAARETGVERLVNTSTSEVYGTARYVPIDENHPLQAQSPYSASKIAADKLAESYHLSFGLPIATIRPFNTFGPRQSARAVIPTIITQALAEESIHLGNRWVTRDFNYIDDTVDAFLYVAECPEAVGRTINIGTGREVSIEDLVQHILCLTNRSGMAVISDDARVRPNDSEVGRLSADNRLAQSLLGWQPRHTLVEGLIKTIDWIRGSQDKYRPGIYVI